jgi:tRNA threonylcarbamoyladenosine modification (KEOPS) complex  Pcc1 subunit
LEAEIILEYEDAKTAESIAMAVSADNLKTPRGLSIETMQKANKVSTQIRTQGKLSTFIATIDDLLFCVSTAEKALEITKKLQSKSIR